MSRDDSSDSGAAMVVVLAVMIIGAIITSTLAAVTIFTTRNTLETKAEMRAMQSADAGLDLLLSMFEGKKYNQLSAVCSQDFVINNDQVHVETSYRVAGVTDPVACPTSTQVALSVTVVSTAVTKPTGLGGGTVERSVAAIYNPVPPQIQLDKAIFSESPLVLTNDMTIAPSGAVDGSGNPVYDANVYSNGSVDCKTQSAVGGSIYAAQSYVELANNCGVKNTVWAKDWVRMSSSVTVEGDVYAAAMTSYSGGYGVRLDNSGARITGAVLTNASIHLQDGARIGEAAYSRTGQITTQNSNNLIGGGAYAYSKIDLQSTSQVGRSAYVANGTITGNGKVVSHAWASGNIDSSISAGTKHANTSFVMPTTLEPHPDVPAALGFPGVLQPPPREQMPINNLMSTDAKQKWLDAGWNIVTVTGSACDGNDLVNYINDRTAPTMLYFDSCTNVPSMSNATLVLKTNIALVVPKGFSSSNDLRVRSSVAGTTRQLYIMTPADAPGVTWTAVSGGQKAPSCASPADDIKIDKAAELTDIQTMIYTPCMVSWSNGIAAGNTFKGQIYGGKVSLVSQFPLQMTKLPVPSLSNSVQTPDDKANIVLSARFDVRG